MTLRWAIGAVMAVGMLNAAPARAQYSDFGASIVNAQMLNAGIEAARQQAERQERGEEPLPDGTYYKGGNGRGAVAPQQFSYVPSMVLRRRNLAQFVESSRKVDPAGAAKMADVFATTDPIKAMEPELARMGLKSENVADAFAVYWITAWEAANEIAPRPTSRAQAQAVSRQAAAGLAATPAFKSASDAQKQGMAEAMLLQAMMIGGYMEHGQADPALKPQIAAAVRQGAKAMNLDLDAARLTAEGFVRK